MSQTLIYYTQTCRDGIVGHPTPAVSEAWFQALIPPCSTLFFCGCHRLAQNRGSCQASWECERTTPFFTLRKTFFILVLSSPSRIRTAATWLALGRQENSTQRITPPESTTDTSKSNPQDLLIDIHIPLGKQCSPKVCVGNIQQGPSFHYSCFLHPPAHRPPTSPFLLPSDRLCSYIIFLNPDAPCSFLYQLSPFVTQHHRLEHSDNGQDDKICQ